MHSLGINGEGDLKGQLANPGSPGKMDVKVECVLCHVAALFTLHLIIFYVSSSVCPRPHRVGHHALMTVICQSVRLSHA